MFTDLSSRRRGAGLLILLSLGLLVAAPGARTAPPTSRSSDSAAAAADEAAAAAARAAREAPLVQLGPGDTIAVQVFGQSDLNATVYVSDDGTVPIALAGPVAVAGLSPAEAASRIERALKDGGYVNDPHVTVTVTQSRSQRVSVLGEVTSPGRYPIDSQMTIFDLLALAGGTRATSADVVYLVRTAPDGSTQRFPIDLGGLTTTRSPVPTVSLRGGDVVYVPRGEQFYIYGEVSAPNMYKIEPGMTIVQAIARAGGITARGSTHRIEVRRKDASGKEVTSGAHLGDPVLPDDVIRVKESLF